MRPLIAILLCLAFAATAAADIECKETYETNEPIIVSVNATNIPANAKLRGSFSVTDATWDTVTVKNGPQLKEAANKLRDLVSNVRPEQQPDINSAIAEIEQAIESNTFHVWAGSGKHIIRARGSWVLTEDMEINGKIVPIFIDFGQYEYEREITVSGGDDGPDPPPPPPPPGARWAVIWEEREERTPQQGNLFLSLRKKFPNAQLQIQDVSDLPPSLKALESQRLPDLTLPVLMVLVRQQDGTDRVIRSVPCPSSEDAFVKEMAR